MTVGTVKTQGTELFFIDTSNTDYVMTKLSCPTGITGLGGAADQIESTCLDATTDREYVRGLGNPGQVSVPFNLLTTGAETASHQLLFTLKDLGTSLPWLACLSESTTDPTNTADVFNVPIDRTSFAFTAYIADVNIDISTNEIVRGTLTLQRSGAVTANWNA